MCSNSKHVLLYVGLMTLLHGISDAIVCSSPWQFSHGNSCYFLGRESLSWTEAKIACLAMDGYLAIMNNADEQNFTTTYMNARHHGYYFWLGGTDFGTDGTWYWDHTGQKLSYTNWFKGEPNGRYNENCLLQYGFQKTNKWNDQSCLDFYAYLCEKN